MLILRKDDRGPDRAADLKKWAEELPSHHIGFLTQVLLYAAEGDYSMFPEMYVHIANIWNEMEPDKRREAARKGEALFFTAEAYERYQKEYADEDKAVASTRAERANLRIAGPDGKIPHES